MPLNGGKIRDLEAIFNEIFLGSLMFFRPRRVGIYELDLYEILFLLNVRIKHELGGPVGLWNVACKVIGMEEGSGFHIRRASDL